MPHPNGPEFRLSLATSPQDLQAAQGLRYDVFVSEMGGDGPLVDHGAGIESDEFDPFVDHMLLHDDRAGRVVGVYRLLRPEMAKAAGQYYSQKEYDLSPLLDSSRRLLELGRSCLHRDYRGGMAMYHLWHGLAEYIETHRIDILFGVASFHGTDIEALAPSLSLLHHRHLAPENLRVKARSTAYQNMNLIAPKDLDRRAAMVKIPPLIKAYLRLGAVVGEGAYIDHAFNTTDVCLIMDTGKINKRQSRLYGVGEKE